MKSFKKLLALIMACVLVLSLTACGGSDNPTVDDSSDYSDNGIDSSKPEKYLNTLTGEYTLDAAAAGKKPVAIMINNVSVAQAVQAGISSADIVFETEVEGGITRLLAFFADVSKVGKIGTIRSLRVPFAEIACGMNALLFYHGMDEDYCRPVVRNCNLTYTEISNTKYCNREQNGLAYEHRLYTSGEKVAELIKDKKFDTKGSENTWVNFNEEETKTAAGALAANKVTVKFSTTSTTQFIYDAESQKYIRAKKDNPFIDYGTNSKELFTNLFVLKTNISNYPDNYHQKVDLSSGTGYYVSAGGAVEIKWTKGAAEDKFKFTTLSGEALTVNQGNNYVCIADGTVTVE